MGEAASLVGSLPPTVAAEAERVRGGLLAKLGRTDEGRRHLERAVRILSIVGSAHSEQHARKQLASLPRTSLNPKVPLDRGGILDAAAILDLASQPELLGREALAVIAELDCAAGAALVATSNGRPLTVLARHQWTAIEARDISRAIEPVQRMAVGETRGRRFYVAAVAKTDLPSRDALAAVRRLVTAAVEIATHRRQDQRQRALLPLEPAGLSDGVFLSDEMLKVVAVARRVAASELPVLITGETGTGKEVLARLIHAASDRCKQSFVAFNCTGLTRDTAESQLFGHRRGAFTDAREDASGVIRGVSGGTLMLDEIGELDLAIQPKLLRFLESGEVQPVGEPRPETANVRVIAATNAAIDSHVRSGRFREDLFYRLNVIRLRVPPLRERREEIPSLVQHFIRRYERELRRDSIDISPAAIRCLLVYDWPGNIRQLANEVRRAVAMAESHETITPDDLSAEVLAAREHQPSNGNVSASGSSNAGGVTIRIDQPLAAAIEQVERAMIGHALHQADGRVNTAAETLGLSRKGLFLKRRRLDIRAEARTR